EVETQPERAVEDAEERIAGARLRGRYALAIVAVLAGAGLLRLAGLGFGLPHLYHWDEKAYFHAAFYSLAAGGRAESLVSGNVPYLMILPMWVIAAAHGLPLWGSEISRLVTLYLGDPTPFYLLGRVMWVGMQLVAIWLVYRLGSKALSRRAGLLAAAFLGVAFLAVSEGHYIKGDTTAMLGAVLCAAAALRLLERPNARSYALLGIAVGLTVAFKFYTYTLVALPLVLHLIVWHSWSERLRNWTALLWAAVGAIVAFVIALPAVAVDPVGTWNTLVLEAGVKLAGLPTDGVPLWLYYWTNHLWNGLGWPLELCGLAGFALWIARRDAGRVVLLAIPILVWIGISSRENQFARYTLPIVPFVALAAGDLLDSVASAVEARIKCRGRLGAGALAGVSLAAVAALVMLPSLLYDLRFAVYTSSPDTRTIAAKWIESNVPAGATVVEEGGQGFEATSTLGVPLRAHPAAVGVTWAPTKLKPDDEHWRVPLLQWLDTYTPTYRITFAPTLTRNPTITSTVTSTAQWGNPAYFVILSWRSDPEKGTPPSPLWDDLRRNYNLSARFDCAPCFPNDPYAWAVDYRSLGFVSLRSGRNVAGPRIWVYERKSP
ncbi:MAG: ArnT family glycosyltransferase, partial [Chloroflexia bacterium]